MKSIFLATAIWLSLTVCAQQKLALIVAIGNYMPSSKIRSIASVNDVRYIKAALLKNGFEEKNIDTLINSRATKNNILRSMDMLASRSENGAIVVVHFACHGQQIRDQATVDLGKDEDDGYDEALLPFDVRSSQYQATGYKGENHLRDDEIHIKLQAIRKKIGTKGSLLILMDACHSGTATRQDEFAVSRGEPVRFENPELPLNYNVENMGADKSKLLEDTDDISNMVFFSGSGPHQLNYQLRVNYEQVGMLSYSFYKAMMELPAGSTYNVLFNMIRARIQAERPDQLPMAEGDLHQIVFSGNYVSKDEKCFIKVGVRGVRTEADSMFSFEKGMMDNVIAGTTGWLYEMNKNEPSAKARVIKSENFRSIGVADKTLDATRSYEIRLDEQNFGSFGAAIKFESSDNATTAKIQNQIKKLIEPLKFLSINTDADLLLSTKASGNTIVASLFDITQLLLWSRTLETNDSLSTDDKRSLLYEIKVAMRIKYLRTLPDGGTLAKGFNVTIVPDEPVEDTSDIWLRPGAGYSLRMENNSDVKLFYTVISISPDNKLTVLYPHQKPAPDYSIDKKSVVIRKLGLAEDTPLGREMIKVIVAREPMDIKSVIERKKERNDTNSFQKMIDDLFKDSDDQRSTRGDISNIKVEEVGIISTSFGIRTNK